MGKNVTFENIRHICLYCFLSLSLSYLLAAKPQVEPVLQSKQFLTLLAEAEIIPDYTVKATIRASLGEGVDEQFSSLKGNN